jgi:hypothetical protein
MDLSRDNTPEHMTINELLSNNIKFDCKAAAAVKFASCA